MVNGARLFLERLPYQVRALPVVYSIGGDNIEWLLCIHYARDRKSADRKEVHENWIERVTLKVALYLQHL